MHCHVDANHSSGCGWFERKNPFQDGHYAAGIACIVGGATTLVGSTSQNTANSFLMQTAGYEMGMGVFDVTRIMWIVDIVMVLYFATIGYTITKKTLKPGSPHFDDGNQYAAAPVMNSMGSGFLRFLRKSRSSRSLRWEFALWDLSFVVSGPSVPI